MVAPDAVWQESDAGQIVVGGCRFNSVAPGDLQCVGSAHGSSLSPALVSLYEWTDYYVGHDDADELWVGNALARRIAPGVFHLRFENQLGLVRLEFRSSVRIIEVLHAEVISRKFPSLDQRIAFLGSLLNDLYVRASRLPFAIDTATIRGVVESMELPTPLFTPHFMLQHAAELQSAWQAIQSRPYRALVDHPARVPLCQASEADADVLLDVVQSPEYWGRAGRLPLAARLRGHAPTSVHQRRSRETLDTPENRFVLAFMRLLRNAADRLAIEPWWSTVPVERRRRLLATRELLQRAAASSQFADVGEMTRIPTGSRVLLRQEGYRDMLRLWQSFQRARRPLFGAFRQAIEVRDVARLYELWAFFALVEQIAETLEQSPALRLSLNDASGLEWNARAEFGPVGTLVYNRSLRSYSGTLRPDYLWLRRGKREVAFDAKFRLQRQDLTSTADAGDAAATRRDMLTMHAYRDALSLQAAVILYPGDLTRFYMPSGQVVERLEWRDVLLGELAGVGAIALAPGREREVER